MSISHTQKRESIDVNFIGKTLRLVSQVCQIKFVAAHLRQKYCHHDRPR